MVLLPHSPPTSSSRFFGPSLTQDVDTMQLSCDSIQLPCLTQDSSNIFKLLLCLCAVLNSQRTIFPFSYSWHLQPLLQYWSIWCQNFILWGAFLHNNCSKVKIEAAFFIYWSLLYRTTATYRWGESGLLRQISRQSCPDPNMEFPSWWPIVPAIPQHPVSRMWLLALIPLFTPR